MKKQKLAIAGFILSLAFSQTANADSKMSSAKMMPKITDSGALSIVETVDKDEIDAAKKAETKGLTKDVKAFADKMIKEHTINLGQTMALEKKLKMMAKAPDAAKMHSQDAAQLAKISKMSGSIFEKAYMDMMVMGHSKVLDKLDKELIPAAKNADVKKHLTDTRASVANHLTMAKKIRQSLK